MNVTISNGPGQIAVVRKATTLEKVCEVRLNETLTVPMADGSYQIVFVSATTGAANARTPIPFTVGSTGANFISIYSTSGSSVINSRLANSYTLAGYTLPAYVQDNDSFAFFAGFTLACTVRIFRAARRWFACVAEDTNI